MPDLPYRTEPDPAFADRLERDLVRRLAVRARGAGVGPVDEVEELVFESYVADEDLPELDLDDVDLIGGRRSRGRLLVAACLIVAIVAGVGVLASRSSDDGATTDGGVTSDRTSSSTTPPVTTAPDAPVRLFPLPPEGSTPSAPVVGVRVLRLQACGGPSSNRWSGDLALYADGRLIWLPYGDPIEGDVDAAGQPFPRPTSGWF